ncbi:MAG: hypothetical protein RL341_794 [Pseudomonadota bacterium]|jgi:putative adenylate-forming enzyme
MAYSWPDITPAFDDWELWRAAAEVARAGFLDAPSLALLAQTRRQALIRHASRHSAFYQQHYRGIDPLSAPLTALPPVNKKLLMSRFDAWVTDPHVTQQGVLAFMRNTQQIGQYYLGRHAVWTSSGTTGTPGIFVHDRSALAVYDALTATRFDGGGILRNFLQGLVLQGGRAALIAAVGSHYAGAATWMRLQRRHPWLASSARVFSVCAPLHALVKDLNRFQPAFVASYPSVLLALAQARQAGQLAISPTALWSGGEVLTPSARLLIEQAFGCRVVNEYGASECMSIAFECRHGNLHVNADWVQLEPVDKHYQPVHPGVDPHTVLLTNFANRVQPLIRYDLGDRVTAVPQPCPCGSTLPAVRVDGRRDDTLYLDTPSGRQIALVPMTMTTAIEQASGAHRFQIRQTARHRFDLRLVADQPGGTPEARRVAAAALRALLARHGLKHVQVTASDEEPQIDPGSGKLRQVIGLPH